MSQMLFDIVFKGRFTNDMDKSTAIERFAKLFKLSSEKAEKFFDGNPHTLKKSLPMDKANQFRTALKNAGLRVALDKVRDATPKKPVLTLADPGAILVRAVSSEAPKHFNVAQFSIDESDTALVEKKEVEAKQFDLSGIAIDDSDEAIVEKKKDS